MENREIVIDQVVRSFYSEAVNDVFIGYHFRKIITNENYNNINNNLGAFKSHIPKITDFWCEQLIEGYKPKMSRMNLLKVHEWLLIRKGELGRWVTIFNEHLTKLTTDENKEFMEQWRQKVEIFQSAFDKRFFS